MTKKKQINTPKCIACFPKVFRPDRDSNKYQLTMVFEEGTNLKELGDYLNAARVEAYGNAKGIEMPLKLSTEAKGEKYPVLKGRYTLTAKTEFAPIVMEVGPAGKPIVMENQANFYAGCYVLVSISTYPWEFKGRKGIGVNLKNILKVADGQRLGAAPGNEFDEYSFEAQTSLDGPKDEYMFE